MIYKGEGVEVLSGEGGQLRVGPDWDGIKTRVERYIIFISGGAPSWKLHQFADWEKAPKKGVQGIVLAHPDEGGRQRRTVVWYCDIYTMPNSSHDKAGLVVPDHIWVAYRKEIRRHLGYKE